MEGNAEVLHKDRRWQVKDVSSAEDLARDLTEYTWTGCTGFRFGGLLYLNDDPKEYAVVRESDGRQLESVTFGWMTAARAQAWIGAASPDMEPMFDFVLPEGALDHPAGSCYLCA